MNGGLGGFSFQMVLSSPRAMFRVGAVIDFWGTSGGSDVVQ